MFTHVKEDIASFTCGAFWFYVARLIIGVSTYDVHIFPSILNFIDYQWIEKISEKGIGLFGAYSCGGNMVSRLSKALKNVREGVFKKWIQRKH